VLFQENDPERSQAALGKLIEVLRSQSEAGDMAFATAIWGSRSAPFLPVYTDTIEASYAGTAKELDFRDQLEASRLINAWAMHETTGMVPRLVSPDKIRPGTGFVLTTAVYLKGKWALEFDPRRTRSGAFTLHSGKEVQAPFMRQVGRFPYARNDTAQILELPYQDLDASVVFLLPASTTTIDELQLALDASFLRQSLSLLEPQQVAVTIPRFKLDSTLSLTPVLKEMGAARAFDPNRADFSGLTEIGNPALTEVAHQAVLDVNEEGAAAGGATAIVGGIISEQGPPRFVADHPFLLAVVHRPSGAVLFLARIANPVETN
jgi:serpin B